MHGQSKDEVVEKLLIHTIGMVNDLDLDLVMMDREFVSKPAKNTCEEYGVHYLNPTRIFANSDEAETIGGYLSFSRLLADIQREEDIEDRKQKAQNGDVDASETVVFETNHPYVTTRDADGQQMDGRAFIHMIERLIRWYRRRWGIENGFKKQKHFMVRTTSTERDYRFFNFAFACVLYNVWPDDTAPRCRSNRLP